MTLNKIVLAAGLLLILITGAYLYIRLAKETPAPSLPGKNSAGTTSRIRYLPLGDSYTIGESITEQERWPNQLVTELARDGTHMEIITNPAVTGYTSQDLIDRELPLVKTLKPDFVTVQIGVNDYVQGVTEVVFQENLTTIVQSLQEHLPDRRNVVLVTIPDFGKTPAGARYAEPTAAEAAIKRFNGIIREAASAHQLPVADVFAASQAASIRPEYVAPDGLHPSGLQYAAWTDIIAEVMRTSKLPHTTSETR